MPPVFGGASRRAFIMASRFIDKGMPVQVLSTLPTTLATRAVRKPWVNYVHRRTNPRSDHAGRLSRTLDECLVLLRLLLRARWLARNFDVLHIFTSSLFSFYLVLLAKLTGKPVIYEMTLFGADDPVGVRDSARSSLAQRFKLRMMRYCDVFVPISPMLQRALETQSLVPIRRTSMIPNSFDATLFHPPSAEKRAELRVRLLGSDPDGPVFLFVGAFVQRKGFDTLLGLVDALLDEHPDSVFVLVGKDTKTREEETFARELDALVERRDAARQFRVLEFTDRIHEYFQATDVFLFPTRREGFANVILEAQACGVPVVTRLLPGITDYILEHDVTGKILDTEEIGPWLKAVEDVLDHEREFSARAVENAERFTEDAIDRQYFDLYTSM
jgi:glycosyltransferase involved in cell wall biosynthesis